MAKAKKGPSVEKIQKVLSSFSEEEKKQAYAMLQGMLLGKQLAEKDQKSA